MINEIIVRLDDEGRYVIKLGNNQLIITTSEQELMGFIYHELDNLAYFPDGKWNMNTTPITIEQFRKKQNRTKQRRKLVKNIID